MYDYTPPNEFCLPAIEKSTEFLQEIQDTEPSFLKVELRCNVLLSNNLHLLLELHGQSILVYASVQNVGVGINQWVSALHKSAYRAFTICMTQTNFEHVQKNL